MNTKHSLVDYLNQVELEDGIMAENFHIHRIASIAGNNAFEYLIDKYRDSDSFRKILNEIDERSRSGMVYLYISHSLFEKSPSANTVKQMETLLTFLGFKVKDHVVRWGSNMSQDGLTNKKKDEHE